MTTNLIGAGGSQVGRYFTVVSALPATVFVLYVYMVVSARPWSGPLDWGNLGAFRPGHLMVAALAALTLALALNPLQRTLIQVLEGYWGSSKLAIAFSVIRTSYHRRVFEEFQLRKASDVRETRRGDEVRESVERRESEATLTSYPAHENHILPTRLGNALRRYETAVGNSYRLDPLHVVPRLAMVGEEREVAYVKDQRVQLELAARTALLSALAVPVTLVLLFQQGVWMLLALVPYLVSFLTYRGAVALAHEYGVSLAVLTDLNRFSLYERLHLKLPKSTSAERVQNRDLTAMFEHSDAVSLGYEHPTPAVFTCAPTTEPSPAGEK